MPFPPGEKGKHMKRFFGMCSTAKGRAKARGKCPPPKVIHEFFAAERAKKKR